MAEVRIAAESRTEFGKGAARRIRRADKVPAVVYGHGNEPQHVTLPGHDLMLALKTPNVLLSLVVDGARTLVLPKSVQRHPVKNYLEHVDLVTVRRGEKVTVEIPVHTTGEVDAAGLLDLQLVTLTVLAEATSIPEAVEIDISGLAVGASVHASEVTLPAGAELATDADALVLHVLAAPSAEAIEADLAAAEAEVGIEHDAPSAPADDADSGTAEADSSSDDDGSTDNS